MQSKKLKNLITALKDYGCDIKNPAHKLEDPIKQYYVNCWWEHGFNAGFADENDLCGILLDSALAGPSDGFGITIFETSSGEELSLHNFDIKVSRK